MTFNPSKPSNARSGSFSKDDHEDHLLIFIEPRAEAIDTRFGKAQPAARCSFVVDLEADDDHRITTDALLFGQALVPALVEDGDEIVVGVLGKQSGKSGNDFWLLYDPSDEQLEQSRAWLNSNATRSPSTNRVLIDVSF